VVDKMLFADIDAVAKVGIAADVRVTSSDRERAETAQRDPIAARECRLDLAEVLATMIST
jgi:hypothetical protein